MVSVSTTPIIIVPYNGIRKTLIITNNSGATVFIDQSAANITTIGTPVYVGQSLEFISRDGDEPDQVLYGATLAGTGDLRIVEGFGGSDVEEQLRSNVSQKGVKENAT